MTRENIRMRLTDLYAALPDAALVGPRDAVITGIADDSRAVRPGDLFVAVHGERVDGHRFIDAALARGAAAVLCQAAPADTPPVPHIIVPDARAALADVAAAFYGHPSTRLRVVGVTGTDGKTTTCFLLHALLQGTGRPAGLSSTVAVRVGAQDRPPTAGYTTPPAPDVQRLLAEMAAVGCAYAVVEVSSHALMLDRLRGCHVDAAILTTITSDHLDFHGTLEHYRAAKARLFRGLGAYPKPGQMSVAILNRDDASYDAISAASATPTLSYGLRSDAAVRASSVDVTAEGIRFRATTPRGDVDVRSPLLGRFNVSNLLAALAFAVAEEIELDAAAAALGAMPGVPGRMRRVDAGQPFAVVVDDAHTPHALATVLDTLRALTPGRLIVVFGALGERDRTKRPAMGRVAAARCDLVILTDDEPRGEDRLSIIAQIAAGARAAGLRDGDTLLLHPDRRAAIHAAVRTARPGDTVLLAGKGHERSITTGTTRLPWDDEAEARTALASL